MLSWASAEGKRPANSRREAAPLSAVWRTEDRRGQNPRVCSQRRSESIDYCGLRIRRRAGLAILAIHPFSAGLLGAESRFRSPHFGNVAQIRVHVLYKRPEIPANSAVRAIAISVTYRKHEKAENPGSIPVSATNSFIIIHLQNCCTWSGPSSAS